MSEDGQVGSSVVRTFGGRYQVIAKLGEGGMGAVYRVRDIELDEEVALKTLHASYAGTEGALDRFRREVKLARLVTHPNVARVYDLGTTGEDRFLTMELVVGESLAQRLAREAKLALPETLRIVGDIARGLAVAHAAGVVHRDLKPENILLDLKACAERGAERVVLTDFGIAVLAEGVGPSSERTGSIVGTPEYMAPEQVEGREPDGRADVYSLGVVLFQLLTQKVPFDGPSAYVIAAARLTNTAPKVRSIDPTVPEPIADLADAMLARYRDARPDMLRVVDTIDALRGAANPRLHRAPPRKETARLAPRGPLCLVLPFVASNDRAAGLAHDLADAVGDALAAETSIPVIPAATARVSSSQELDARILATKLGATHLLEGSVRCEPAVTRVRVRLVDVETGHQLWGEKFDGANAAFLVLEDDVRRAVRDAVRDAVGLLESAPSSVDHSAESIPDEARPHYERGVEAMREYGDHIERGIESLREANRLSPTNPYVMSALGAALVRLWSFSGNVALLVEAEDWSLRALATGTRIGETFATIGVLRLHQGELRAAVDGFREASARSPRLAEPHSYLGRLMSESGHLEDARRRLLRAVELDPRDHHARTELARIAAMQGEWVKADGILDEAAAVTPHAAGILLANKARFTVWRGSPAALAPCVEAIDARKEDPSLRVVVRMVLPIWRALASGERLAEDDARLAALREAANGASLRLTMFWYQLLAEIGGTVGHVDAALEAIEAAAMRTLIDVHWLDRCPALEPLRNNARLSRARATVAARAAALWR